MVKKLRDPDAPAPDLRFRRRPNANWEYARFIGRNDDGSVELIAEKDGSRRSVLPVRVEFRTSGPRGGDVWVSAEEVERPMDPAEA